MPVMRAVTFSSEKSLWEKGFEISGLKKLHRAHFRGGGRV